MFKDICNQAYHFYYETTDTRKTKKSMDVSFRNAKTNYVYLHDIILSLLLTTDHQSEQSSSYRIGSVIKCSYFSVLFKKIDSINKPISKGRK